MHGTTIKILTLENFEDIKAAIILIFDFVETQVWNWEAVLGTNSSLQFCGLRNMLKLTLLSHLVTLY